MPSTSKIFLLIALVFFYSDVSAGCEEKYTDSIGGVSENIFACKSTLANPSYHFSLHITGSDYFGTLTFGRGLRSFTCSKAFFSGEYLYNSCPGVFAPGLSYKSGNIDIDLVTVKKAITNEQDILYSYPTNLLAAADLGCHLLIYENDRVEIGFDRADPFEMIYCLIDFEHFVNKNLQIFRSGFQ